MDDDKPKAKAKSFANQLLVNLQNQRKEPGMCDVVLRCGPTISVQVHSCLLAAISKFFRRLVQSRRPGGPLDIDLGDLFRYGDLNRHFPALIDAFYRGQRLVSRDVAVNKALGHIYAALELDPEIDFEAFELQQPVPPAEKGATLGIHSNGVQVSTVHPASILAQAQETKSNETTSATLPHPRPGLPLKPKQPTDNIIAAPPNVVTPMASTSNRGNTKEVAMDVSICSKCNLFFVSKEEFISHRKVRACCRKFTCQPCGNIYNRVQSLISHLVEVRHGETVCSVCHFAAESQSALEQHIAKHAEDLVKPYFCHSCESRFSTRKRWDQHLPKHSTEAPHVCQICNKGFKWKHALAAHTVVHSDEKQFLCQECGFSTSHSSTFKFHQRNHSGQMMRCEAVPGCTFQTTGKSNLVQHQLTHSKEKPHQCEVCGRSFSLAKNMRRHARQHDRNAVTYNCSVTGCSFRSLRSDKYLEHMKRYHPPENEPPKSSSSVPTTTTPANENSIKEEVKPPPSFLESTLFHNRGIVQKSNKRVQKAPTKPIVSAPVNTVASDLDVKPPPNVIIQPSQSSIIVSRNSIIETEPKISSSSSAPFVLKHEPKLAKNLFNTISPPNKTVNDALSSSDALSTFPDSEVFRADDETDVVFSPEEVDAVTSAVITDTFLLNAAADWVPLSSSSNLCQLRTMK